MNQIIKTKDARFWIIVLIVTVFLFMTPMQKTHAGELLLNGVVAGEGTHFEVVDSDYLNIVLESSESISIRLESVPKIITLVLRATVPTATSTTITIGGLSTETTYYKYEDSYRNLTEFTADETGRYSYVQNIVTPHVVFIQPIKSTKFIRDDATGGDCASFGFWDNLAKVCTLTQNISETIEIDSNNIILNGNNFTVFGSHTGSGVYLNGRSGVVIKNLRIENFSYGISVYNSSSNRIENNNFINNDNQAIVFSNSGTNTTTGNTVSLLIFSFSRHQGFVLYNSHGNIFQNNAIALNTRTIASGHQGILLFSSNNNNFISNSVSDAYQGILLFDSNGNDFALSAVANTFQGMLLFNSSNNIVHDSIIRDSQNAGIKLLSPSSGNQVYHNNFIENQTQATVSDASTNILSLPKPIGGNYWSNYDEPNEGCDDINADKFCDLPYVFSGKQDDLPWVMQDGWKIPVNQSPTISSFGQLKSDGITAIFEGGITGEPTVTFKATLTDPDNDQVKLQVEFKGATQPFDGTTLLGSDFVASGSSTTTVKNLIPEGTYHWRARAVDHKGNAGAWQEFGTVGNMDFEVKLVPLYTQVRSNYPSDEATDGWAVLDYADGGIGTYPCAKNTNATIARCGCALASAVMVARYYDVTQAQGGDVNPKEMNHWLQSEPSGYKNGDINWDAVSRYTGYKIKYEKTNNTINNYALLDQKLTNNQPVIAKQNSGRGGILRTHFMVIDNKLATNYGVKDPAWYNTKTLNDTTNSADKVRGYENGFDGLRIYKKGDGIAQSSMNLTLGSPAELFLTDPQGRKLGKDKNGTNYEEIPNGAYFQDGFDDPLGDTPVALDKNKLIQILDPIEGQYRVEVIGTGAGSYGLWSSSCDAAGNAQGQEFHSETAPGYTATYNINFDSTNATNTVTRLSDEIPPEVKISFNPILQELGIQGTDNTTVNPAVSSAQQGKEAIYQINDEAGNTIKLAFSKIKQEGKEIKAELKFVQYNNVPISKFPKTELKYEWSIDKKTGEIKELEQKLEVKNTFKIKVKYGREKNETEVKIEKNGEKETKQTLSGLVIIKLTTASGVLGFEF